MGEIYSQRIDENDIVVAVSENWQSLAEENSGLGTCFSKNVVGASLWAHIREPEKRHLCSLILQKVREHHRQRTFSFRCDSPKKRSLLILNVIPHENGFVDFKSQIVKTELGEPVELLRVDRERAKDLIKICSMCKKIAISETEWEEIDIAVQEMKLFEWEVLPRITHGLCQPCFDIIMAKLDKSD